MIRATLVLTVALAASACSMLSVGYNRLPELTSLWLNRQIPLETAQQDALDQDLHQLLAWHRQTQLTPTADLLRRWQDLATTDLSADQLCREFDSVRQLLNTVSEQALPAMVRLANSLGPRQQQALAAAQRESHAKFRDEHLPPTGGRNWLGNALAKGVEAPATPGAQRTANAKSQDKRFDTASDRYAMLYGRLSGPQQAALRQSVAQSVFSAPRTLAERERRTQDLLNTLVATQAASSPAEATAQVRAWLDRLQRSPTPGYPAYAQALTHEACAQLATVHQLASPAQRQQAANTLAKYESDLRQLSAR